MAIRNPLRRVHFGTPEELVHARTGNKQLYLVPVTIGKKTVRLVERIDHISGDFIFERFAELAKKLRKLKLSVVPTVMVLKDVNGAKRFFYSDLSMGGKFAVEEFVLKDHRGINPKIAGLNNFAEIREQISKEISFARKKGFSIEERCWLVQIDPETNTGKPYIWDLKWVV